MRSKKTLILVTGIITTLVIVSIAVFRFNGKASGVVMNGTLSQRAQEFVTGQRQDPASSWQSKQLDSTETVAVQPPNTLQETPCFSINLPLPMRTVYQREETDCVLMVRLTSPAAKLTISTATFSGTLSEQSDVHMREVITDTYQPAHFETTLYSQSKTFSDPQGISFFTIKDGQLIAVVFSETNDREKILQESLPKVLEALMVY